MKIQQPRDDLECWYDGPGYMSGYASTLPVEQQDDPVQRLHDVVAEVTGKPVEVPPKPRMGFL